MGIISEGRPFEWNEIKKNLPKLKRLVVNDIVNILKEKDQRQNDPFIWGDEIEFTLVRFDHQQKSVQLLLKSNEILNEINNENQSKSLQFNFHAEDCNFVLEGIPSKPYSMPINNIIKIEENIKSRKKFIKSKLDENESIISLSLFPRLGCFQCTYPDYKTNPSTSFENSLTCPDEMKTPNHPRTLFLNRNVIQRRKKKISIDVPIYRDEKTLNPFIEDFSIYNVENWRFWITDQRENSIRLDSSSSGWGCSCLQVTFQSSSFDESLFLHDQLLVLTPIFLSLSVSCPIWRGYLTDIDSRWNVLSQITDDRTQKDIENQTFQSSRYGSSMIYLSDSSRIYNDKTINFDKDVYKELIENDCPTELAKHFSNLILRDPLYVTDHQLSSTTNSYNFENHNSMIWNSLRFKPAQRSSNENESFGWRIEFRPMELQITDFQNTGLIVFLSLLTRAILSFRLDLRIPVSLIKQNIDKTQNRNQIEKERFFFSTNILLNQKSTENPLDSVSLMSIDEIINGSNQQIGLIQWVEIYLNSIEDIQLDVRTKISEYLQFIGQRARGEILTNAMFIRKFVQSHENYRQDSIVNDLIQYDLLKFIEQLNNN